MLKINLARAGKGMAWACVILAALGILGLGVGRICGYQILSVQSNSMQPAIYSGDAVIITTKQSAAIKQGQIVSYRSVRDPRVITTHRVLDVNTKQGSLITKGDDLTVSDANIPIANVVGTVSKRIPNAGYLLDAFRSPVGLALGIYLPVLAIVLAEIRGLSRYYSVYYPRHYILYR